MQKSFQLLVLFLGAVHASIQDKLSNILTTRIPCYDLANCEGASRPVRSVMACYYTSGLSAKVKEICVPAQKKEKKAMGQEASREVPCFADSQCSDYMGSTPDLIVCQHHLRGLSAIVNGRCTRIHQYGEAKTIGQEKAAVTTAAMGQEARGEVPCFSDSQCLVYMGSTPELIVCQRHLRGLSAFVNGRCTPFPRFNGAKTIGQEKAAMGQEANGGVQCFADPFCSHSMGMVPDEFVCHYHLRGYSTMVNGRCTPLRQFNGAKTIGQEKAAMGQEASGGVACFFDSRCSDYMGITVRSARSCQHQLRGKSAMVDGLCTPFNEAKTIGQEKAAMGQEASGAVRCYSDPVCQRYLGWMPTAHFCFHAMRGAAAMVNGRCTLSHFQANEAKTSSSSMVTPLVGVAGVGLLAFGGVWMWNKKPLSSEHEALKNYDTV